MLAELLLEFYQHSGKLTRDRHQLVRQSFDLLQSRWDTRRGIETSNRSDFLVKEWLSELAFALIMDEQPSGGTFTASWARSVIGETGSATDRDRDELLNYYADRGGVITEVGDSPGEGRLYAFTHRLFVEYLAAEHFTSLFATEIEFIDALRGLNDRHGALGLGNWSIQAWANRHELSNEFVQGVLSATEGSAARPEFVAGLMEILQVRPRESHVNDFVEALTHESESDNVAILRELRLLRPKS